MISNQGGFSRALKSRVSYGAMIVAAASALTGGMAWADTPAGEAADVDSVVITGYRASLQNAIEVKRESTVMVDAINAEDIADFPDANLAESLQRLPGVSIDRDNGEGRTITVRGLGADFTRVRLNGLEALSTAGANDSGTNPNRSRQFDFSVFASELFSSLKVSKTAEAATEEGSLGATIDLVTGRPFNFNGPRLALTIQDGYYENGGTHNPRFAGLVSNTWYDGKVGALFSIAYNSRDSVTDSYGRQAGQSDYLYRQATFATTPNPGVGLSAQTRQGFAAPTGTACNNGVVPGVNITNLATCDTLRGSNPAIYALINNPQGSTLTNTGGTTTTTAPGSLVRIPALATLNQQLLQQDRLGMTLALQFRPTDKTLVSFDVVYSRFFNNSENFQVQTVGLNRNNTNNGLNTVTSGTAAATRRGFYNTCTARAATDIADALDCGQQLNGGALVPGTQFSFNPFNLEPFDYYNAPSSVGFVASPDGVGLRDAMIGRPSVRLIDGALSPTGANADYLVLGNVDIRSADDQQYYTTTFQQYSINLEQEFTDNFRMSGVFGISSSRNASTGILVDLLRLDSGQGVPGNQYLVYDERGDPSMPLLNLGFDAANPANWDFVKNYSVLRHFERSTKNTYAGGRLDFVWDANDTFTVKFGGGQRRYGFSTITYLRQSALETLNPSLREANSTVGAVTRVINWGQGLDVPAGTTTSFIAPDNQAFINLFDFTCNCVNKWGDWRISYLASAANVYEVKEIDTSAYIQTDFKFDIGDTRLRGNLGGRFARTEVIADGLTNTSRPVSDSNTYSDFLPSLNLAWELNDQMMIRFGAAKVMSRPLLGNLAPSVTAFTVPTGAGAISGGSLTVGNTHLSPFRAVNYDLSFEWYFAPGGLFSVAIFDKEVSNFPQTVVGEAPLTSLFSAETIAQLRASQTNANALAYIDANNPFVIRQFRDAPGGYIRGIEVNYQQNFTFLPGFLKNFGIQANYTYLESELSYIVDPGAPASGATPAKPQILAPGPFTGASPQAFNLTLFYEVPKWSVRVSTAYRAEYFTQYPIASGTCDPGFCDSPLVNDVLGSGATLNVDATFSYKITSKMTLTIEAFNLTNQTSDRFAYRDDPVVTKYEAPGRQLFVGLKAVF